MNANTDKRKNSRDLLCVPVSDMRGVLDSWNRIVEKYNNKDLDAETIKNMDDALANIVQFTKRPAKPLKF